MDGYRFRHEQLGELVGLERGSNIVQFRGIPFAHIPSRFRQSKLYDCLPSQPFDARQHGPFCPQIPHEPPAFWDQLAPDDLPITNPQDENELSCLNLTITVPRTGLEQRHRSKIPVLVYIHGGAFIGGSQSISCAGRDLFDATNLVKSSLARTKDTIVVTINYRLGVLGFLASKELEVYNKSHSEAAGNYGLHDQARALEWVNRYIHGFGGDPEQVTVQGTSAGSLSVHYLAHFPDRKFKRAILASGTTIGLGPKRMEEHQINFQKYVDALRASRAPTASDVELVQSVPAKDLVTAVGTIIASPLVDGEWVKGDAATRLFPEAPPELMIGACSFEKGIVEDLTSDPATMKPLPNDKFLLTAKDLISTNGMFSGPELFPFSYPDIVKAYGIENGLAQPTQAIDGWTSLLADVMFRIPPMYIASLLRGRCPLFIYEIAATNPFPKWTESYRKANHGLNDIILFNVAEDAVPTEHLEDWRGAVTALQTTWLDFCHGQYSWLPVRKDGDLGPICRFDNKKGVTVCQSLDELVGEQVASRWRAVLGVSKGLDSQD